MTNANLLSLELFNCVVSTNMSKFHGNIDTRFLREYGIIIAPGARYAQRTIEQFIQNSKLSGEQLNKTFYNSWQTIQDSSRLELLIDQIIHYMTTYGTDFTSDYVYIPREATTIPEFQKAKMMIIRALPKEEVIEKALALLQGIAMKAETIDSILNLLGELDYTFTGEEGITNKEAIVKIAELYGVLPSDNTEFLRYLIYRATNETLIIKNSETITAIKNSGLNVSMFMRKHGLEKLAQIFNRYKPLFLAFKAANHGNRSVINRIAKLSKKHHKPMVQNPLNLVTQMSFPSEVLEKAFNKATPFMVARTLMVLYTRANQDTFCYNIRNGKSWVAEGESSNFSENFNTLWRLFIKSLEAKVSGKTFYMPEGVNYALPTSEKNFVGNIPQGSQFESDELQVGIYWEDAGGARDLDLSGLGLSKIGWNAAYNTNGMCYSGDITSAPNGAVEYLYSQGRALDYPTLVLNNVYSGSNDCKYRIIVGTTGRKDDSYMMNPNNLMMYADCNSVQKQTILGILLPAGGNKKLRFTVLNIGSGNARVSGNSAISTMAKKALYQKWNDCLMLKDVLLGANMIIVDDPATADFDLSPASLEKDTLINLINYK